MKAILLPFLLAFGPAVFAAPAPPTLPSAYQIIQKEARLVFTDGSSYYDFEKNGTFYSGPLGLSGRTIKGTWKLATVNDFAGPLVIKGTWGWDNGASAINDRRTMTMSVYPEAVEPNKKGGKSILWYDAPKKLKVYRCYFEIEELVAQPKGGSE